MTKQKSFFIRDENLSEFEKISIRQSIVADFSKKSLKNFSELFTTQLPTETIGKLNCENLIGSVEVPIGVAGPVIADTIFVNSKSQVVKKKRQTYVVPLATTEGALVASIHRGLKILNMSETKVTVKKVGMSRSVVFECDSIEDALVFDEYFMKNHKVFAKFCEETSSHLQFISYESFMRDKLLYFRFVFDTDEAMGMNMVTIALSYAWDKFKRQLPNNIWVTLLTVSGNVCTDKKDSMINRLKGRGFFVTVESKIALTVVEELLKVNPKDLVKTHLVKNVIGSNVAGSFAQNMHVANALAAFYLATGQDIAHVVAGSEASVHFEIRENILKNKKVSNEVMKLNKTTNISNNTMLYVALALPNVSVGSIGGGTWLPKQSQARSMILSDSEINSQDLAAAVGLAALAGEVSGLAALTTDTLASAHAKLGRSKK